MAASPSRIPLGMTEHTIAAFVCIAFQLLAALAVWCCSIEGWL